MIVASRDLHSGWVRKREVEKRSFGVGGIGRTLVRGFSNGFCVFENFWKNVHDPRSQRWGVRNA